MKITAKNVARIKHSLTGKVFVISGNDLVWEVFESHGRSMGVEIIYTGVVEHEELGELQWSISEYPVGFPEDPFVEVGDHQIVSDFEFQYDFELENGDEDGPTPETLVEWLQQRDWTSPLSEEQLTEHVVHWFHYYYEDPVHSVSYNTREGGYLWVFGPYDAGEVLSDNFARHISEDIISKAVDEIQSDGTFEWTASQNHPERRAEDDDAIEDLAEHVETKSTLTFDELKVLAAEGNKPVFGTPGEAAAREKIVKASADLKALLPDETVRGSIGHNNPPDELSLENEQIAELKTRLSEIETELAKPEPGLETVTANTSYFQNIIKWAAGKADKTVDSFCASFGDAAGKGLVASLIATSFWEKIVSFFIAVKDWLMLVLGI